MLLSWWCSFQIQKANFATIQFINMDHLSLVSTPVNVLPSANLVLENIGFVYPFYAYEGNRPLAPVLRQRQCSLLYNVYWLARWWCSTGTGYFCCMTGNGIKIPGIQSRIRIEYLLVNNEIKTNKIIEWNTEQKSNKDK